MSTTPRSATPRKSRTRRKTAPKAPRAALAKAIASVDPAVTVTVAAAPAPVAVTMAVAPVPAVMPEARTASITVGLVKGKGLGSWLIRWLAKGGWSHCVAIVLPGGMEVIDARADVIDGIPAGVQRRPITYLKGLECLWLEIPCTPAQAADALVAAESIVGDKYDKTGIVDFVTGQSDNSWKRAKEFFCSAAGTWILWKAGILGSHILVPFTDIDPGRALGIYWGLGARETATPAGLIS